MLTLKVKKLDPNATLPKQANEKDSGYDVVALEDGKVSADNMHIEYRTGLAIQPPDGYHILIHPRGSISKYDLVLHNSIGLADPGYRGEYICRFRIVPRLTTRIWYKIGENNYCGAKPHFTDKYETPLVSENISFFEPKLYKKGDKIAQLVLEKTEYAKIVEVTELDETDRGEGRFGSTGK